MVKSPRTFAEHYSFLPVPFFTIVDLSKGDSACELKSKSKMNVIKWALRLLLLMNSAPLANRIAHALQSVLYA